MKRLFLITNFLVFCLMTLLSCGAEEKTEPIVDLRFKAEDVYTVSDTNAEAVEISVKSNADWKVTADAPWVSIRPSQGQASEELVKVVLQAEDNLSDKERIARVTIQSKHVVGKVFEIHQNAYVGEQDPDTPQDLPKFVHAAYMGGRLVTGEEAHEENLREFDMIDIFVTEPKWSESELSLSQEEFNRVCIDERYVFRENRKFIPDIVEKCHQAGVKVLCVLGGGSEIHLKTIGNPQTRMKYARMVAYFVQKYGFDGLDIDWELNLNLTLHADLMADFRTALSELEGDRRYYLTTDFSIVRTFGPKVAEKLVKNLDWINVMAYDLGASREGRSAVHNTLHSRIVNLLQTNWLKAFPSDKLVLAYASYGYRYNGMSPGRQLPQGDIVGNHQVQVSWVETASLIRQGWTEERRSDEKGVYYFSPDKKNFISIENEWSILFKYDLAVLKKLRGLIAFEYHRDWYPNQTAGQRGTHTISDVISRKLGKL